MKRNCPARICSVILIVLVMQFLSAVGIQGQNLKPAIVDAFEAGDTARAVNLLNQEIEIDKGYHLNYYTLGLIHFHRQQYAEARERFEQALDKKSKHYESLYYLGRCLISLGEYDEAEERLRLGMKKSKKLKARFENGMGLLDLVRLDYQKADRQFRKALAESEAAQAKELKDLNNTRLSDEERQAAIEESTSRYARE
ncbi:MAG: tetratricopeptide repeat protein, partial [candidate division Zixibacteria bacterium]|nr:tetratricopeptide repeat protein [candidate division Zixibacteria bacterium]